MTTPSIIAATDWRRECFLLWICLGVLQIGDAVSHPWLFSRIGACVAIACCAVCATKAWRSHD